MLKCTCQPNNAYSEFEIRVFKCKWKFNTSATDSYNWTDDLDDAMSFHFWVYTEEEI